MVVSFLQLHPREDAILPTANLGVLLIEFFELYGRLFNYKNVGIRVKDGGSYVPKEKIKQKMLESGCHPSFLCIEDPLDPTNDIGRSSYGVVKVREAFEYAFFVLNRVCGPSGSSHDRSQSILGKIVQVSDDVVEKRKRIKERFPVPNPLPLHKPVLNPTVLCENNNNSLKENSNISKIFFSASKRHHRIRMM